MKSTDKPVTVVDLVERALAGKPVSDRHIRSVGVTHYEWDHFHAALTPEGKEVFMALDRRRRALPVRLRRRHRVESIDDFNALDGLRTSR